MNRGDAYYGLRQYDKAIGDYTAAIQLNPNDARAYNDRGTAYRERGNLAKSSADFYMAARLNAGNKGLTLAKKKPPEPMLVEHARSIADEVRRIIQIDFEREAIV